MNRSSTASRFDRLRIRAVLLPFAGLALAAALSGACGSSSTNLVAPTAQKCQISVANFTGTFGASGGSGSATIDAARECSWTAASQATWISLSSGQGTGSGTLAFSVAANQVARARSGALVVNGQQLTISQAAAACTFAVTASTNQVDAAGGTGNLSVSTVDGCSWTASADAPWLHLSSGGGSGSGSVSFSTDPNTGAARSAVVTIAGQSVTIAQAAAAAVPPTPTPTPPPPPPSPGCQYSLSPTSLSFAATGGQATLRVDTSSGCAWTATSDAWIAVTPQSGTKTTTITVSVAANTSAAARSGAVTIAGQTVSVDQAASAAASPVELGGTVSARKGDCPAISFNVAGTAVTTDANTEFVNAPCNKVKNGTSVVVAGLQQAGQPVLASRVTVTGN